MKSFRSTRRRNRYINYLLRTTLILGVCCSFLFTYSYYKTSNIYNGELLSMFPKRTIKFVFFEEKQVLESQNISNIRRLISKFNTEETILNKDSFGAVKDDSSIFVIFIDVFSTNLNYLIVSLSQIEGIEDALIIFSHSYFDEKVNSLIMTIDFCRVIQIFYPHSVQVHPNEFPGYQIQDCPQDMNIKTAEGKNCVGASFPDIHGRYRNPSNAERKHHWWWTANKVFENLACTANHKGIVIFSECNVFFTQDFLYMALYMKNIAKSLNQCDFYSLGVTTYSDPTINMIDRIDFETWDPVMHSTVLAFDVSIWKSIVAHYDLFCYIDDYSWYRSLYYVSLNRRDGKRFKVISSGWPRAFKISSCQTNDCEAQHELEIKILQSMNVNKIDLLYPPRLELYINIELENDEYIIFDYVECNGGWNDPRDKELCYNMTESKIRKVLIDMKNEFKDYRS